MRATNELSTPCPVFAEPSNIETPVRFEKSMMSYSETCLYGVEGIISSFPGESLLLELSSPGVVNILLL